MPQLDPTSFASQLFWLTVTFVFLYVVLARFLVPRLASILEGRQGRIDTDLAAAERFRKEAEAARESYEKSLAEARSSAQQMLAKAQAEAASVVASQLAALDQELNAKLAAAQKAILATRDKAITDMASVVADLAARIVEKITHVKPQPQKVAAVVDEITHGRRG